LIGGVSLANGQSLKQKVADKYYDQLAYASAVELYEDLATGKRANEHVVQRTADCYRLLGNTVQSEFWYEQVVSGDNPVPGDYYHYSQCLKSNGKYALADKFITMYYEKENSNSIAEQHTANKDYYIDLLQDSLNYTIDELPVNSEESDFAPVLWKDQLVFASNRRSTVMSDKMVAWDETSFLDVYGAINENGSFSEVGKYFAKDLTSKCHDGPVFFDHSNGLIYITRTNAGKTKSDNNLKIYVLKNPEEDWGNAEGFPYNSDEYSVGHPALTPDGKTMYFISDMPGGYGETDIWKTTLENGKWSKPENLGSEVNTQDQEMFPYISEEGNLYFASRGHLGLGGLDVYVAFKGKEGFLKPKNMGYPMNTRYDDFSLIINEKEKKGYFSSNRPGGKGKDDIYKVELKKLPSMPLEEEELLVSETEDNKTDSISIVDNENVKLPEIVLKNIYFGLDESEINKETAGELDRLVRIMKENLNMKIEIGSHTDSRASEQYNQRLSQKRAKATVYYFVDKGIDRTRLTWKGYGESQLLNQCDDGQECSEEQHKMNRRTEFRVVE